ncbi:MAG TPA: fused MFS/spermidine synthase [Candidatus Methylomirabilis sp.]|nr:fused MFS/spermidine synthase [Candidatus Methylomirabilis sp.]
MSRTRESTIWLVLLLFALSGAAALIYETAWARSLYVVFGGTHLAVTTVLTVFMGGLALGSQILGKRADRAPKPLRLYGQLELGIAFLAAAFMGLSKVYPIVYPALARFAPENPAFLSALRAGLALLAMLGPTTLMGGTLPVLTRFVCDRPQLVARPLSIAYGLNTFGAVAGSLVCGFVLLPTLGLAATQCVAIGINLVVGAVAIALSSRVEGDAIDSPSPRHDNALELALVPATPDAGPGGRSSATARIVFWGSGVTGFCALGYEVIWTRMLSFVVGTSVYSFTVILVAFLSGIAVGSALLNAVLRWWQGRWVSRTTGLALAQIAIGMSAVAVTALMRDLTMHASRLQIAMIGTDGGEFASRHGASFILAAAYFFVPACLSGAAFPLAATLVAEERRAVGPGIGSTLMANTIGSLLGAALAGFLLIRFFGIERTLHLLSLLVFAWGLLTATAERPRLRRAVAAGFAALVVALAVAPQWFALWEAKYFAVFFNNRKGLFDTPEKRAQVAGTFEVVYFHEGSNETISVIRDRDGLQSFVVNGRSEATTYPGDIQLQRALGHLPMLLHPNPRKVFVLGTGAGMTLGAIAQHSETQRIVLAEIEPAVLPATRTFGAYNHNALDDPRLHIVFNDGRNHLMITEERFDVITADPIHPWSGGAAYLYTSEYFASVAKRLLPGGVAGQWLPLYELSSQDLRTIVRTFAAHFTHVHIWLTYSDAVLIGSQAPILIDESQLAERMGAPRVKRNLASVEMLSAEDLLSYFLMGTTGARAFAESGALNTDDNLYLEFAAPHSMGVGGLLGQNIRELSQMREPVLHHLVAASGERRREQLSRWGRLHSAGRIYDIANAFAMRGETDAPEFVQSARQLDAEFPSYAPLRFLRAELARSSMPDSFPLAGLELQVLGSDGTTRSLRVLAILTRRTAAASLVWFTDGAGRVMYGRHTIEFPPDRLETVAQQLAQERLAAIGAGYREIHAAAQRRGQSLPTEAETIRRLKEDLARRGSAAR